MSLPGQMLLAACVVQVFRSASSASASSTADATTRRMSAAVEAGPEGWLAHPSCVRSFAYLGNQYDTCTWADSDAPWCSHEAVFQENRSEWSYCHEASASARSQSASASVTTQSTDATADEEEWFPSPSCVSTFTYNNQTYEPCTWVDSDAPWCSHEAVFQENRSGWSYCFQAGAPKSSSTTLLDYDKAEARLEGWIPHPACAHVFSYQNRTYVDCTAQDSDAPWCSHDVLYSNHSAWSYCHEAPTPADAATATAATTTQSASTGVEGWLPGRGCARTFNYDGHTYENCTWMDSDAPWCSHDALFHENHSGWSYCHQASANATADAAMASPTAQLNYAFAEAGPDGWLEHPACAHIFAYQGHTYMACTWEDSDAPWCSHEAVYHENRSGWSYCHEAPASATTASAITQAASAAAVEGWFPPPACARVFKYSDISYEKCTWEDSDAPWCSHDAVFHENHSGWSYCEQAATSSSATTPAAQTGSAAMQPTSAAVEGWLAHPACARIFTYGDAAYQGCTWADSDAPWCSHEAVYHENRSGWSYCFQANTSATAASATTGSASTQPTSATAEAVPEGWFPHPACARAFAYNGTLYVSCTWADSDAPWCSHEAVYHENSSAWSYCHQAASGASATTGATTGSASTQSTSGAGEAAPDGWFAPPACARTFAFNGTWYVNCTWVDSDAPWCSHEAVYHENRSGWSYCHQAASTAGASTAAATGSAAMQLTTATAEAAPEGWFPHPACARVFAYNGTAYANCTWQDSDAPWCSHEAVYNARSGWSYCLQAPVDSTLPPCAGRQAAYMPLDVSSAPVLASDAIGCQAQCAVASNCAYWTFMENDGTCHFSDSGAARVTGGADSVAGPARCADGGGDTEQRVQEQSLDDMVLRRFDGAKSFVEQVAALPYWRPAAAALLCAAIASVALVAVVRPFRVPTSARSVSGTSLLGFSSRVPGDSDDEDTDLERPPAMDDREALVSDGQGPDSL